MLELRKEPYVITVWPAADVSVHLIHWVHVHVAAGGLVPGRAVTSAGAAMCSEWAERRSISQREREAEKQRDTGRSCENVSSGAILMQLTVENEDNLYFFQIIRYFSQRTLLVTLF